MATGSRSTTERLRLSVVLRSPVLHFVAAGALLFAADRWWSARTQTQARGTITLAATDVTRLRREWTALHGSPPSAAEEASMIDSAIDQQILEREARRLALDRDDRLVRDRLVKLGQFLDLEGGGDGVAAEEEARAVGLEHDDPVIGRYLAHLMEIGLAGPALPPSEAEVRQRWQRQANDFTTPSRLRLSQVFVAADSHGDSLRSDAERLLAQLQRGDIPLANAAGLGDPFALGTDVGPASAAELERSFGPGFAAALEKAPIGAWAGPIPSSYGLHLVWLHERMPARAAEFDAVRNRVAWDVAREHQAQRLDAALRRLRQHYRIEVDGG